MVMVCSGRCQQVTGRWILQIRQGMAELYANAHKFEITHKDFLTIEPCMDTSYVRERTMSQPSVSSLLTASLRGTKKSLVDTYNQLNSASAPRAVGL
ncbi:hypothetical protein Sde_2793 [Saccharophagus degradans 2-40]|uniref:Uncharacterized protein n=2 Tax=Saccharophagus degradans TaxID=86304 RepID=Q21GX9_SACD2|nr:hypothetical protein Sde_2793 [Saccharophagus degradans 2-40]